MADFRLVVVSSYAAGAIAIRGPIALSILIFLSIISSPDEMDYFPGCTYLPSKNPGTIEKKIS